MNQASDASSIIEYEGYLISREKAPSTIEKYLRDIKTFLKWLDSESMAIEDVRNEDLVRWKDHLQKRGFSPSSINSKLAALNGYLSFIGKGDVRAHFMKVQRQVFRDPAQDLTRKDYERLLEVARREGHEVIALIMETICSTGMRVSEIRYLTVEALKKGRVDVVLKNKVRSILIPKKLKRKLLDFVQKKRISSGPIFLSPKGEPMSRNTIWSQMKALCVKANVTPSKVFPHNLRHLFACAFYDATKDIVKLADVLGHSSIETTRIYLISSGAEHARLIEQLGLVV